MERRLRSALDLAKPDLHKRVEGEQERQKDACDPHTVFHNFKMRDLVYAWNYRPGPMWEPGSIIEIMGLRRYRVRLLNEDQLWHRHLNHCHLSSRGRWWYTMCRNYRCYWNLSNNRGFSPCLSASWGVSRRCRNNCLIFNFGNRWKFKTNTSLLITRSLTSDQLLVSRTLPTKGRWDVMTVSTSYHTVKCSTPT